MWRRCYTPKKDTNLHLKQLFSPNSLSRQHILWRQYSLWAQNGYLVRLWRDVLVPVSKTNWQGKVNTRDFDACIVIVPITSVLVTSMYCNMRNYHTLPTAAHDAVRDAVCKHQTGRRPRCRAEEDMIPPFHYPKGPRGVGRPRDILASALSRPTRRCYKEDDPIRSHPIPSGDEDPICIVRRCFNNYKEGGSDQFNH